MFFDLTTILSLLLLWLGVQTHWWPRLLVLVLLSPLLRYLLAVFGFGIRLALSQWAGTMLQTAGFDIQVMGNVLLCQASTQHPVEMSVDPACTGLQMTGVSVLVAIFLMMHAERLQQKRLPVASLMLYALLVIALTLLCNLFRIVLLVAFMIGPDSWLHDAVGLICVVAYAWLPAWGLSVWLVRAFGKASVKANPLHWRWGIAVLVVGFGVKMYTSQPYFADRQQIGALLKPWKKQGFSSKQLPNKFWQLTKPGQLIYLKPVEGWWSAEHSPTICWAGSGYELKRVQESNFRGHPCYVAELRKPGHHVLYTAWWFTNGHDFTTEQLYFRWQMLKGADTYALINLTTEDKAMLNSIFNKETSKK